MNPGCDIWRSGPGLAASPNPGKSNINIIDSLEPRASRTAPRATAWKTVATHTQHCHQPKHSVGTHYSTSSLCCFSSSHVIGTVLRVPAEIEQAAMLSSCVTCLYLGMPVELRVMAAASNQDRYEPFPAEMSPTRLSCHIENQLARLMPCLCLEPCSAISIRRDLASSGSLVGRCRYDYPVNFEAGESLRNGNMKGVQRLRFLVWRRWK